ncbi:dipeptide/oligopeptide/nickel ABC transporter permease/ATP-binding protein [uncultured Roseibium sp.]|uniref:dipeptide/oligopeptide/nickel ABC transporter permease/ATP-binding protein n=1 Tax=uncultured Roseibium sp. TaxID=1936171 RepID=UPI003216CA79
MTEGIMDIKREPDRATKPRRRTLLIVEVLKRPLGLISVLWLAMVILVAIFANQVAPYDPLRQDLLAIKQYPSTAHLLGTDAFGRDVLSRIIAGTSSTVAGICLALSIAAVLGVIMGVAAGYFGRWIDRAIGLFIEIVMALPNIIVLLVILTIFQRDMFAAMITVGVFGSANTARIVRGVTLGVRNELYIEAARIAGLSDFAVIWRHVIPRILGPITVQLSVFAAITILIQTGISFLGLGIQPPNPSWGGMILDASVSINDFPWLLVPSGLTVATTILAFGLLGDSVRDSLAARWTAVSRPPKNMAGRVTHLPSAEKVDGNVALSVRGLSIMTWKGGEAKVLVDNLCFDLLAGETLGIAGESGSGKTLSSLAILGLLPAGVQVMSGAVQFGGKTYDLTRPETLASLRGCDIAMIFQEPMAALDPCYTVGHHLVEVIRRHETIGRAAAHAKAVEALREVQISDAENVMKKYPHQISGGMAQRVGIARALLPAPSVLLADEPTTALDVTVQAETLDLMRLAQERRQMAMLFVTHDWGVVADICDRAMVMYQGKQLETANVDTIFSHPQHPYTRALLAADPHRARIGERLPTIQDVLKEGQV